MEFNLNFKDLFELPFGTLAIDDNGNIMSCGSNVRYYGNVNNQEITRTEKINILKNMPNKKYKLYKETEWKCID